MCSAQLRGRVKLLTVRRGEEMVVGFGLWSIPPKILPCMWRADDFGFEHLTLTVNSALATTVEKQTSPTEPVHGILLDSAL